MKVIVEKAREDDWQFIARLGLDNFIREGIVSSIRDPDKVKRHVIDYYQRLGSSYFPPEMEVSAFIARVKSGKPLGYVLVTANAQDGQSGEKEIYILDLVVAAQYRHRGVGKALLLFVEDFARKHNVGYVGLRVSPLNKRAWQYYHRLGYVEEWIEMTKRVY